MNVQIDTYWNVQTLYYVFNAITALMSGSGFQGALKFVFMVALGVMMFAQVTKKRFELGSWFLHAFIFVTILCLPIGRVALVDKTNLEPPRVVDHVPWSIAVLSHSVNLVGGWMADWYETVFRVPDDLRLGRGDVGWGGQVLKSVGSATVSDPVLRADLMQFFKECTMYDLKDGAIQVNDIVNGADAWSTIFSNTSPARFVTMGSLAGVPQTTSCLAAATVGATSLQARVVLATQQAQAHYGKRMFGRAQNGAIAGSLLANAIGTSYDWILGSALNASQAMRQAMFNNVWRDAGTELPALLGDTARVAEVQAMAGAAMAAQQSAGANSVLTVLGREVIPTVRNWLEAIVYSVFPVVVLLIVVSKPQAQLQIFSGYAMSLVWLSLWPVMYAVVNHLYLLDLRSTSRGLLLAGNGVTFQLSGVHDATLTNKQSMLGAMVIMVPVMASAVVKMAQGGFMSTAEQFVSLGTGSASSAGSSLAGGNVSTGRASFDSVGANTTALHKFDSNTSVDSGMQSVRMASGDILGTAAGGAVSVSQMRNNLLSGMSGGQRFDATRAQSSHLSESATQGWQMGNRSAMASSFSDGYGHDAQSGDFRNASDTVGESSDAGHRRGIGTSFGLSRNQLVRSFFDQVSSGRDSLIFGAEAGAQVGGGGGAPGQSGGASRAGSMNRDMNAERRIKNAMQGRPRAEVQRAIAGMYADKVVNAPASPQAPSAPLPPKASLGLKGGIGFGAESASSHGRGYDYTTSVQQGESLSSDWSAGDRWSVGRQDVSGQQWSSTNSQRTNASLTENDERFGVSDSGFRRDAGTDDRASRSESSSFDFRRDYLADPQVWKAVAARHGMSATRFAMLNTDAQIEMIRDYVIDGYDFQASVAQPTHGLGAQQLPVRGNVERVARDAASALGDPLVGAAHEGRVLRSGYESPVRPEQFSPRTKGKLSDVQRRIQQDGNDLVERTKPLTDRVFETASPDRIIGEGRRNVVGSAHSTVTRGLRSTARETLDFFTGGKKSDDGSKAED